MKLCVQFKFKYAFPVFVLTLGLIYGLWFHYSSKSLSDISSITLSITAFGSFLIALYGIIVSLHEFKLKQKAERRLAESSLAEIDTKLLDGFLKLLPVLESRKTGYLSEKIIENVIEHSDTFKKHIKTIDSCSNNDEVLNATSAIQTILSKLAIVNELSGASEQKGCIQGLYELATNHKTLKQPCIIVLNEWKNHTTLGNQVNELLLKLEVGNS